MLKLILSCFAVVVLAAGLTAAPARAQVEVSYGQTLVDENARLIPAALDGRSISDMNTEHLISVAVGAAIVAGLLDFTIGGGIVTVAGLVGGALLGDYWYREGYWPFGSSTP